MKQFLYLDTDIVNSIIAQSEKGLMQELSMENENSKETTSHLGGSVDGGCSTKGSFFNLIKADINLALKGEVGRDSSAGSTSKEIISKVLHDSAFDIACSYINPKKYGTGDNPDDYGDYVLLTRVFDFVDMEYLENLFSKDGLISFLKKTSKEKIETEASAVTSNMSREQLRTSGKRIKGEIKKLVADSDKQYDDIHDIIKAFRQVIPYTYMLISCDGYLIPLDDKFFRIDPKNLGFKYGGEISCVGMITNIIGADTDPNDSKNIFATLQFQINEVLRTILPTNKENLCVIHPIAIYYGE